MDGGPDFRYEAPQAGRYRQHFQLDAEIVGTDDPDATSRSSALLDGFHRALGLTQRSLVLNSLGDDATRAAYLAALTAFLTDHRADLSEQSRETLAINPLRVLDSRRPEDQPVVEAAPQVLEFLTPDAETRFDRVQQGLKVLGIAFEINPRLVRGPRLLQPHPVRVPLPRARRRAERHRRWRALQRPGRGRSAARPAPAASASAPASSGSCWPATPRASGRPRRSASACTSSTPSAATRPWPSPTSCARAGISADRSFDQRSMKAQMKAADRSGADVAVIVGPMRWPRASSPCAPCATSGPSRPWPVPNWSRP